MIKLWAIHVMRVAFAGVTLFAAYAAFLCVPQPFFAYSVRAGNLVLYSDRMLPDAAARNLLRMSLDKLESCPLYAAHPDARVFICNSRWRQRLFFNKYYGVGGLSLYPV